MKLNVKTQGLSAFKSFQSPQMKKRIVKICQNLIFAFPMCGQEYRRMKIKDL
jgi:hypothetical protein